MSKTSIPSQEVSQPSCKSEEEKRKDIVSNLRNRENGWLTFIEDGEIIKCIEYACRASSLSISPDDYAHALYIALLDLNYAESWASMIEEGKFCNKKTGEWTQIDSVAGWMKGQFRKLLSDIEFMKYLYGNPKIMYQSLSTESRLRHREDDDNDEGNDNSEGAMTCNEEISDESVNSAPVVADDERTRQLNEVLRLVEEHPEVGPKYKELIERYFIRHDDLEQIAVDFRKKGWITTNNRKDPVGAVKKTIQNRTVPSARDLFDKIAGENGFQCRISDLRRKKTDSKKKRK